MSDNLTSLSHSAGEVKLSIHEPSTIYNIATHLQTIIQEAHREQHHVIILCIGTDRSTGDSLGPLTGSKLRTFNSYPYIYGTLDEPVHATNLKNHLEAIHTRFSNPFIIAVDACLGRMENVGCISLGRGPLRPGSAVNKNLPAVGNAYINGIVNVGGFMEHLVLQSTRLQLVMKMSDIIAHSLSFGLRSLLPSKL
jgi:putative sporulation protein YyaC